MDEYRNSMNAPLLKMQSLCVGRDQKVLVKLIASPFGKDYAQLRVHPRNKVSDS